MNERAYQAAIGDSYFDADALARAKNRNDKARDILVYMTPDEFLSLAAEGTRDFSEREVAKLMRLKKKFSDIPFLDVDEKDAALVVRDHEGRHRARALKNAGVTFMPVSINTRGIRWGQQENRSNRFDYVESFPTMIIGQRGNQIPLSIKRNAYRLLPEDRKFLVEQGESMNTFRPPYHVDFHSERGEVTINVTDADGKDVWYATTETVNELIEDGFLSTKGFAMGRNLRPDVLERSVLDYLNSVGIIDNRFIGGPSRDVSRSAWGIQGGHASPPLTQSYEEQNAARQERNAAMMKRSFPGRGQNPFANVNADDFHPMRGHVADGVTVRFNNGSIYTVKNTMAGWILVDELGRPRISPTQDATVLAREIFGINSRITSPQSYTRKKNPMFSGEGHEEGIPRFGRFYDRNGRVAVFGERDNYRIEYPFMDGPVKAYWFEKVNGRPQGAFAIRHNTPEAVRLLVKETEAYDSSTPFYEPRVHAKNPMFSGEGHEEGIPRFGRFYDRNGRIAVFGERDNYRIEYPFMDGPVKAVWFEKVNGRPQGAFAIRHNTPEAVRLLVKETEAYDSSTPFYEPRVRRDNPTATEVASWVDHYKGSMEKRIDGVPEKSHYVIAIQTTDNQSAFLRVGKGSKFDTDPAKARVYRNSDKANEAATKVMNWLKKKYPAKAKKIKSIGVQPKK